METTPPKGQTACSDAEEISGILKPDSSNVCPIEIVNTNIKTTVWMTLLNFKLIPLF